MLFGVFVCQLSLVSGLSGLSAGLAANAFGGGLKGSLLANSILGGGSLLNTYIDSTALTGANANSLLLDAALSNHGFGGVVNTALTANALGSNPNDFFLAGALSGGFNNGQLGAAALSNAFGGGISGALAANAVLGSGNTNGNFDYSGNYYQPSYSSSYNSGYSWPTYSYPTYSWPTYSYPTYPTYPTSYLPTTNYYPSASFDFSAYPATAGCWISGIWYASCVSAA
jgi:hypothetical protein